MQNNHHLRRALISGIAYSLGLMAGNVAAFGLSAVGVWQSSSVFLNTTGAIRRRFRQQDNKRNEDNTSQI